MKRERWWPILMTLALGGCVAPWEILTPTEPPMELTTAATLPLVFERGALQGAEGSPPELEALIAIAEDELAVTLDEADGDVEVRRGSPGEGAATVVIHWEQMEPGRTGLDPVESLLTARVGWRVDGRLTDALRITERVRPSIFALQPADRLRRGAARLGRHVGAWLAAHRP